jgi:integrase
VGEMVGPSARHGRDAPATIAAYRYPAKRIHSDPIGGVAVGRLRVQDVVDFYTRLKDAGITHGALRDVHKLLGKAMRRALGEERVSGNVVWTDPVREMVTAAKRDAERPRRDVFRLSPLSESEVQAITDKITGRYRALVLLLGYMGPRISEASAIRMRNANLEACVIRIVESSPEVAGHKLLGRPTKTRQVRSLTLPRFLAEELQRHVALYPPNGPDGFLFTASRGGPIRQNAWRKRHWDSAVKTAGVSRQLPDGTEVRPAVHDLRHAAASIASHHGASLKDVQAMLGHSSITVTASLYTHLFPEAAERIADRLDRSWDREHGEGERHPVQLRASSSSSA